MFLFYYTLAILFISAAVATLCFSAYTVSRQKIYFISFMGFTFYFFDVSLVFRNDFLINYLDQAIDLFNTTTTPFEFTVFGAAIYLCFWLAITTYLNISSKAIKLIPVVLFVIASLIVIVLLPEGNLRQFTFFSVRTLFALTTLAFAGIQYHRTKDSVERERLSRHWKFYVFLWVGTLSVLFENILFFLIFAPPVAGADYISFRPERNIAENIFMLGVAFYLARDAFRLLNLYFERTPNRGEESQDKFIQKNLDYYAKQFELTDREKDVLNLVLLGYSNQDIANELVLSISTVKVHVHNILNKTKQANRQELSQNFWKTY